MLYLFKFSRNSQFGNCEKHLTYQHWLKYHRMCLKLISLVLPGNCWKWSRAVWRKMKRKPDLFITLLSQFTNKYMYYNKRKNKFIRRSEMSSKIKINWSIGLDISFENLHFENISYSIRILKSIYRILGSNQLNENIFRWHFSIVSDSDIWWHGGVLVRHLKSGRQSDKHNN